jgi:hypothetical protein
MRFAPSAVQWLGDFRASGVPIDCAYRSPRIIQAEQQRLRDEANAKRAEARAEQAPPNPHGLGGRAGKTAEDAGLLVEPQIEAQPTSEQPTATPQPEPQPKKQPKPKKLAA